MSYHPKQPPVPRYGGPTVAERFADDLQARAALKRHELPIPPQLKFDSIQGRYPAVRTEQHDDGRVGYVLFMDSSAVRRNDRQRWVVES